MKNTSYEKARKLLLGEESKPLTLCGDCGEEMNFEQVFAAEREDGLYCILRPLSSVEGLGVHTALVFHSALVFSVDGEGVFRAVTKREVSEEIFAEYYSALKDAQRKE